MNPENPNPVPPVTPPVQPPVPEILPSAAATGQTQTESIEPTAPENVPPPPPIMHEIPKPKHTFAVIVIIFLILTSFASLGYWAYQTYIVPPVTPVETPTPIPATTPDPTVNWKTFTAQSANFSFKYPQELGVTAMTNDFTSLKANPEYFVGVNGSDVIYLSLFLYKSNKSPADWWTSEGKNKFEQLRVGVENAITPKTTINLTYDVTSDTIAGHEALNVVVNSDNQTPQTPTQRFLNIFQQNGYIVMASYQDMGTTQPSIDISKQILSTFKFLGQTDTTSDWKQYTSQGVFLQVKYPSSWRLVKFDDNMGSFGVGPSEVGEDVLWAVNFYGKTEHPKETILADIGKQFTDRTQTTKNIDINGVKALEIITTTPSNPSWYSDTILIEYGTTYITLSNGAISDSDLQKIKGVPAGTIFKDFYSTAKFMN